MHCWCNKLFIGIIVGLILPIAFSYLLFLNRYHGDMGFMGFIEGMLRIQSLGKLLSISVLPNLLLFFIALWTERLLAARGIVTATMIYTILAVILYLIR